MNPIHNFLIVAAAALFIGSAAGAQAKGIKVGIAAEPYPPFTVKDASGKWVGWEIDVMNALCQQMDEKCDLVEVAWDGIIPALTSKQIDVILASMAITEERKKTIDFSNMYYDSPVSIIGQKNGDLDIKPEHLKGKSMGVQVSTIQYDYANKYYADSPMKTYQTQDEGLQDLVAGRIDYYMGEAISVGSFLRSEQGIACCELKSNVPPDSAILGVGVGAGIRKDDSKLKEKLNSAISKLAKSGELKSLADPYPDLKGTIVTPAQ